MHKPIDVKPLSRYRIWVKFSDGEAGEIDLSPLAGKGVFAFWEKKGNFEKVYIDSERGTVAWSDDIDLCPDTLYMQVTGKSVEEIFPNLNTLHHTHA